MDAIVLKGPCNYLPLGRRTGCVRAFCTTEIELSPDSPLFPAPSFYLSFPLLSLLMSMLSMWMPYFSILAPPSANLPAVRKYPRLLLPKPLAWRRLIVGGGCQWWHTNTQTHDAINQGCRSGVITVTESILEGLFFTIMTREASLHCTSSISHA